MVRPPRRRADRARPGARSSGPSRSASSFAGGAEPRQHRAGQLLPGAHRDRDDVRDHQRRHRPVGRLGLRARGCARRVRVAVGIARRGRCCRSSCAALIGLVNGLLIGRARMAPFIVTLATLLFARGLAFAVVARGQHGLPDPGRPRRSPRIGQAADLRGRRAGLVALAVFAVGLVVLNRTRFGQAVYAIGGSPEGAELMGLPVARVKVAGLRAQRAARRASPASSSPRRPRRGCRPSARAASWRRSPPSSSAARCSAAARAGSSAPSPVHCCSRSSRT